MSFAGFPSAGLQFMRDLVQHNTKEWFEAHKAAYIDTVQIPAVSFVAAIGSALQAQFSDVQFDLRTNGSGSLLRIHRDVRFSADKSPYKTNIAMMFASGKGKKMAAPGFGLQITPEQVDLMAGLFSFDKPQLEAYRQAVLDEQEGAALEVAAATVQQAGNYTIEGAEYKRVPAGYAADHPRAAWLKHTGLYATTTLPLAVVTTPDFVTAALEQFVNMAPLQRWLVKVLNSK